MFKVENKAVSFEYLSITYSRVPNYFGQGAEVVGRLPFFVLLFDFFQSYPFIMIPLI